MSPKGSAAAVRALLVDVLPAEYLAQIAAERARRVVEVVAKVKREAACQIQS